MARPPERSRRFAIRPVWAGVAAAAVVAVAAAVLLAARGGSPPEDAAGQGRPAIGGPFALQAGDGSTVTDRDFLGQPFLVFFGFTTCPDVCPTTLATVGAALDGLDAEQQIEALFVTLDPERDTPEAAHAYASAFHPRIRGLGGSPEQIATATAAYRVYSAKVPLEDSALGYTIDHTAFVYMMAADGTYRQHFSPTALASDITAAVRSELAQ